MLLLTIGILLVATGIDLRQGRIPNWLTLPFLGLALVWAFWDGGWGGLGMRAAAGVMTAAMLLPRAGAGDVKLSAGLGVVVGWPRWGTFVAVVYVLRLLTSLWTRLRQAHWSFRQFYTLLQGEVTRAVPPLRYRGAPVMLVAAIAVAVLG